MDAILSPFLVNFVKKSSSISLLKYVKTTDGVWHVIQVNMVICVNAFLGQIK